MINVKYKFFLFLFFILLASTSVYSILNNKIYYIIPGVDEYLMAIIDYRPDINVGNNRWINLSIYMQGIDEPSEFRNITNATILSNMTAPDGSIYLINFSNVTTGFYKTNFTFLNEGIYFMDLLISESEKGYTINRVYFYAGNLTEAYQGGIGGLPGISLSLYQSEKERADVAERKISSLRDFIILLIILLTLIGFVVIIAVQIFKKRKTLIINN